MAEAAKVAIAPALVVVALVLDYYGRTAGHWTEVLRPIAVLAVGSTAVSVGAYAITRRPFWAMYAGVLATCGVARPDLALPVIAVGAAILVVAQWRRIHHRSAFRPVVATAIVPCALLVLVQLVGLVQQGALTLEDFAIDLWPSTAAASGAERRSIYVLLVDGYPRSDALQADLRVSNAGFISALELEGLSVSVDSRSTFERTELSLAATMLGDVGAVHALEPYGPGGVIANYRATRRAFLVNVPTMDRLRAAGYRLEYTPTGISHTDWRGWDVVHDSGQATDLEVGMLQDSILAPWVGRWVMDQQRARVDDSLSAWTSSVSDARPKVSFAHLMVPHPPFLYGPDGRDAEPLPCWAARTCSLWAIQTWQMGISDEEYAERMAQQIATVDVKVLEAVRSIVDADPAATVVLFSDHGDRFDPDDKSDWRDTFLAARNAPPLDGPDGLFVGLLAAQAAVDD